MILAPVQPGLKSQPPLRECGIKLERSGWSGECSEGSKGMLKFFGGKTIEETSGLHRCKIIWSSLDY